MKCEVITYEKQGEVLTDRLRDGMHKIFLRTSKRQYTEPCSDVNTRLGCDNGVACDDFEVLDQKILRAGWNLCTPESTTGSNYEAAVLLPSLICRLTAMEGWPLIPD